MVLMDNKKLDHLSTTCLLNSDNDPYKMIQKVLIYKQELINRIFGKGQ